MRRNAKKCESYFFQKMTTLGDAIKQTEDDFLSSFYSWEQFLSNGSDKDKIQNLINLFDTFGIGVVNHHGNSAMGYIMRKGTISVERCSQVISLFGKYMKLAQEQYHIMMLKTACP